MYRICLKIKPSCGQSVSEKPAVFSGPGQRRAFPEAYRDRRRQLVSRHFRFEIPGWLGQSPSCSQDLGRCPSHPRRARFRFRRCRRSVWADGYESDRCAHQRHGRNASAVRIVSRPKSGSVVSFSPHSLTLPGAQSAWNSQLGFAPRRGQVHESLQSVLIASRHRLPAAPPNAASWPPSPNCKVAIAPIGSARRTAGALGDRRH